MKNPFTKYIIIAAVVILSCAIGYVIATGGLKILGNDVFDPPRPVWDILADNDIKHNKELGEYSITYHKDSTGLIGKKIIMRGFMIPLESSDKVKRFLLSKSTPSCFFCPPDEVNNVIDVYLKDPIAWSENMVTVKGTFNLTHNTEVGLFVKLEKAVVVEK